MKNRTQILPGSLALRCYDATPRAVDGFKDPLRLYQALARQRGGLAQRRLAMGSSGEWLRPDAARLLDAGGGEGLLLRVLGSRGSTWSTPQRRAEQGWADAAAVPGNIYALVDRQPGSFEATVAVAPRRSGEQAGLVAYAGEDSWVKLVVEGAGNGDGGGVFLAFAEQRDGEPFLRGKLPLPQFGGEVALRLVAQPASGTALAFWRIGAGDWAAVTRGLGWLEPGELEPGQERGRLPPGDPRGEMVVAECTLPGGWRAVLMTEQWPSSEGGGLAEVAFSAVASVPQPEPEPEPEPEPVATMKAAPALPPPPQHPSTRDGDPCACCSVGLPMSYQTGPGGWLRNKPGSAGPKGAAGRFAAGPTAGMMALDDLILGGGGDDGLPDMSSGGFV